jgi:hypothetical protein
MIKKKKIITSNHNIFRYFDFKERKKKKKKKKKQLNYQSLIKETNMQLNED